MNKTWKNIGLIALAAGVLYYPALRMYRLASEKKHDGPEGDMQLEKGKYKVKKRDNGNNMGEA